jgi:cytochrome c peroxidase
MFRVSRIHRWLALLLAGTGITALAVAQQDEPLLPLPEAQALDERKVALGRTLFRNPRFSRDNAVACITCHSPASGGADARPVSSGSGGVRHQFNSPTVWNSAFNFRQLWTGGAATLEDVVDRVVKSPMVFDSTWVDVLSKLNQDAGLVGRMKEVYSDGMTAASVMNALAVYQRSLVTPSRFDMHLRGDANAIDAQEKKGYARFKAYGCVACHQGVNIGGNMYQRFGALNDYFADRVKAGRPLTEADNGRFTVTRKEQDRHLFKVPSLRNVAQTAPYFHDGSVATLEEAVDVMFKYQLGRTAPADDKAAIVAFLKTLSGQTKE